MGEKMNKKIKNILLISIVSICFTLIVTICYYIPEKYDILRIGRLLKQIENYSLSMRFNTIVFSKSEMRSGSAIVSENVTGYYRKMILVLLDNQTVSEYGSLNFSYDKWADIVKSLEEKNPKIAWFDLNWKYEGNKTEFINALKDKTINKGNSIILESFEELTKRAENILPYDSKVANILKNFELNLKNPPYIPAYQKIVSSSPDILSSFQLVGARNMSQKNNLYQKAPMIVRVQYYIKEDSNIKITNVYYPSSVLLTIIKILDSDLSNVVFEKNSIIIKNAKYEGKIVNFRIPVDRNYDINVKFRGLNKSGFLRTLPLKDFTRAGLPRDSILIFGGDIEGFLSDKFLSPVGLLTSTEYFAYALGTILNREFLIEVPEIINIIYLFALVIIISLLAGRRIELTSLSAVLAIALPLGLGFGLFLLNFIVLTFIPLIVGVFSLIFGQIYLLLTEEKEKRQIKATFSKYVSPEFVNILVENPDIAKSGGVEKEVTMLFSDIRSFTTLSEGMSARELIEFLNDYLSIMTNILMENKGTLDKYIGDAIVGFWGAPIDLEDHAYYACLTAVKMMKALHEFNTRMEASGKNKINIGIGLNSGKIIVGNIGSEKKMNYTAIGDTAILTEELQDENKTYNTNIVISEFTYEKVKDYAKVRELGEYKAKHRDKPIKIYELIDMKEKV